MTDLTQISDKELEDKWQHCATMISNLCQISWQCPKSEEQKYRNMVEDWQKKQQMVQKEITRRGK